MPRSKSASGILAIVGDLHTNSKTGLCPPRVVDDMGGEYRPNPFQRWLWKEGWIPYWQQVKLVKETTGLPVVVVINGDTHDGDHHGTYSIVTKNEDTMLRIAVDTLEPAIDVADEMYIIRGTPAHEGNEAWLAERLARDLDAITVPSTDFAASWWHLRLELGGVLFDIQHHPESGDRTPRTRGHGAQRIAHDVFYDSSAAGQRVPDVILRSHLHGWRDSGTNHPCRAFILNAWQGPTDFVFRIGQGAKIGSYGGMWFVCRDGEYTFDRYTIRPRKQSPVIALAGR